MKAISPCIVLLLLIAAITGAILTEREEPVEATPVSPTIAPVDWEEQLIRAVATGNGEAGREAGDELGISYADLLYLSRIMAAESGPEWPDCYTMMIGEVVLNRVESPEWPNNIIGVLNQTNPVQYAPVWEETWTELRPTEKTIRLALRLLRGERVLNDELVVYQALFPQGEQTVATYWDEHLDTITYFCRGDSN